MTFAVFGRPSDSTTLALKALINYCDKNKDELLIHKFLTEGKEEDYKNHSIFDKKHDFKEVDLAISIGGDGTFIRLSRMVASFGIPVLGVNTGRLGFLADISIENIAEVLDDYKRSECDIENRTLLQLHSDCESHSACNIAINEISVLRQDTSSLLLVHLYANDKKINSYWADGLIIATPTGSTAYSMAAGGPIVTPESESLIITPISPHSLTVRPLIISKDVKLTIKVESRSENYMVAIDSRSESVSINEELNITCAPYPLKVAKQRGYDYYSTLREKLMWGKDKRG